MRDSYKKTAKIAVEEASGLRGIKKLVNDGNLKLALKAANEFMEKFPKNKYIKLDRAVILCRLRFYEEAISVLENLEKDSIDVYDELDRMNIYKFLFLSYYDTKDYYSMIKIMPKLLKYKNRIDNFKELYDYYIIAKRELNLLDEEESLPNFVRYTERQLINYSKLRAITHIKKHLNDYELSVFNKDIDVENLYYLVRNKILEDVKKAYSNRLVDCYRFKYPGIGVSMGEPSNTLEVISIAGTNDIITMYPTNEDVYNSVSLFEEKLIVRSRKSQIDKFNNRYKDVL